MLKLVLGTAGTGKSTYVKNQIQQLAQQGKKCMLIVPEQFSKTGEAEIFSSIHKAQLYLVKVYSFTSLLRDAQSQMPILNKLPLTQAGKTVMAQTSINAVHHNLKGYKSQRQNMQFAYMLTEIFDDFKRSGLDGQTLFSLAQKTEYNAEKLKDIALIYSEYSTAMGDKFCDHEDMLLSLCEHLPYQYTDETTVFIDGFESFSYAQYQVVLKLLKDAQNVTVTLTADDIYDNLGGAGSFSYTKRTAQRLISFAKKSDIPVAPVLTLTKNYRFKYPTLRAIDEILQGKPPQSTENDNGAFINSFENQFKEVSYICAQINRLVKNGYKYDDIAIVSPQLERYENQFQDSFALAQIPYFIDQKRIITSSAPVMLIKSILDIMQEGINEDTILPLLKTQLTCFDEDSISMLENYLYMWQEYDFDFDKPFELSPDALETVISSKAQQVLEQINDMVAQMQSIFRPHVVKNERIKGSDILKWSYEIVEKLNSEQLATNYINAEKNFNKDNAELLERHWETTIACLDELYSIVADSLFTPFELASLFMLMVNSQEIGFAPQTQDCVIISSPQRMKLDAVKIVFITGASQDIFPAIISPDTVLSQQDREYLKSNDYPLNSDFENKFSFENLYFYKALTTASEALFISHCNKNLDSQEILSAEIENIKEILSLKSMPLSMEDYCINKPFFKDYISETNPQDGQAILQQLDIPFATIDMRQFKIEDKDLLNQILGEDMVVSPSGAESYYKCAFMYFLQRILKVKPLEKITISSREAGDYLHYIAQMVMEKYKQDYYLQDWDNIKTDIKNVVEDYIDKTYPPTIKKDPKFTALQENMHRNAQELLHYIYQEQNSALFRPFAFEKPIGFDSDIKPLKIAVDEEKTAHVVGVCDRIDVLHADNADYIRIVDYKTGSQDFNLDDVFNGLSSQLLLYMSAILENGADGIDNPKAAAVLYQPSDALFKFDKDNEKLYTAVGMAVASKEISKAFDEKQLGSFGVIKGEDKITSLKGSEVVSEKLFDIILSHTKDKIKQMAQAVYGGEFDSTPLVLGSDTTSCKWCQFSSICQNKDKQREKQKNNFKEKEAQSNG